MIVWAKTLAKGTSYFLIRKKRKTLFKYILDGRR